MRSIFPHSAILGMSIIGAKIAAGFMAGYGRSPAETGHNRIVGRGAESDPSGHVAVGG